LKSLRKRACRECPDCLSDTRKDCFWQIENQVPESFKPSKIKAYISVENISGIGFLRATDMNQPLDPTFLSWFVTFCVGKNLNAFWRSGGEPFFIGSQEFVELAWRAQKEGAI
jgi:hypothetical protein